MTSAGTAVQRVQRVQRVQVLQRCASARLLVVEAPSGYGKTTLIDQLATERPAIRVDLTADDHGTGRVVARLLQVASRDRSLAAAAAAAGADTADQRLGDLAAMLGRVLPRRGLVVLDDVHHLGAESFGEVLGGLAHLLAGRVDVTLAVVGRSVPGGAPDLALPTVHIGASDLAFDREETARLVGSDAAALCRRLTDGWPAAVALWAAHGASVDARAPLHVLDALVAHLLRPLDAERRSILRHVPLVDHAVGAMLGWPNLIGDVQRLGVPVRRSGPFLVVVDAVRDRIPPAPPPPLDGLAAAAHHYVRAGDVLAGLDLLFAVGRPDAAAELLGVTPPELLTQLDLHELRGIVETLPPPTPALPDALLVLARAAGSRMLRRMRAELLDRVERLELSAAARAAVEVERVWDLAQNAEVAEAERRGFAVLEQVDADPVAKARCLYSLGQSFAMHEDEASFDRAAALFSQCAGIARASGLPALRAAALSALSYRVHLRRGQFDLAWARAEEALSLVPRGTTQYGALLSFAAEVLDLLARDDEALDTLVEARAIGRDHADARTIAYAAWNMAKVHARRRDAAAVHDCLAEADANRGDWYDHPTGAEFLAVGAQLLATAGDVDGARPWLDRALQHPALADYPDIVWSAQGAVALADGDHLAAAEILRRLLDEGYTEPVHRWQYRLWIAWAEHRLGHDEAACALIGTVQREAAGFGHPELPARVEPERWPVLLALAERARCGVADGEVASATAASTEIRLLGEFQVRHDARPVTVPPGKPDALVKLLALSGRPLPADEVTDVLWGDAPTDVGMRRLRNVLSRVNAVAPLVVRDGTTLALAPGVVVDAVQFEAAAQLALRSAGADRAARVVEALARYGGELLPGDRFAEHTVLARERIRSLAVRLNETLADHLAMVGDPDGAAIAIERLLEIDPYDDRSADRAASLLTAAGRHASARTWTERAERIRAALGAG